MKKVIWNLDDIATKAEWEDLLKDCEKEISLWEKRLKKLDPEMTIDQWKKLVNDDEDLGEKMSRLGYLPSLMESVDQKDQTAKLMKSQVTELSLKLSKILRKLSHWIKGLTVEGLKPLDESNAKRLFRAIPDLEYNLHYARAAAKYSLSQDKEDIVSNKDAWGISQLLDLREIIETEQKYMLKVEGKKEKVIKTQSDLLKLVYSTDHKVRKAAYQALLDNQKENLDKLFLVYQAVVKDWGYEMRLRGYDSPIGVRNFGNQISDKSVETLLNVCRKNRSIFWRYFKLKAKALGVKKLERWDIYAPIARKESKSISFDEAKAIVLDAFGKFSNKFQKMAIRMFDENHIDSHPRSNKRNGAFCATVSPKISPYVLLNHTERRRDVLVMAHELGHAIHSMMAENHYPSVQHANLPLAETASTLSELVVFDKLIGQMKESEEIKTMLWEKMDDAFATILRQNYFVIFEKSAHDAIEKGVTAEQLCEIYYENLKEEFGDSVKVDKSFRYEWAYISHLVESPFYCYAYNFGELLSYAIYKKYKEDGDKYIERIEMMLASGGSEDPMKLLKDMGFDVESEAFWQGSFDILDERLIWLEKLHN